MFCTNNGLWNGLCFLPATAITMFFQPCPVTSWVALIALKKIIFSIISTPIFSNQDIFQLLKSLVWYTLKLSFHMQSKACPFLPARPDLSGSLSEEGRRADYFTAPPGFLIAPSPSLVLLQLFPGWDRG